jgi:nucleoside-diphosphate-sugar epimerase
MSTVLVTGGSGFIGCHCILQLLAAGYQVRTTVRNLKRETDVRAMLKAGGAEPGDRLSFIAADLENDAGWSEAVAECEYVLHVASPLPASLPKHEDELIVPAREGTLRVLRAMTNPAAKSERFLAVTGDFMSMVEIAKLMKSRLGEAAKRVPTTELPDWLVRLAALRDPAIRLILTELGKYKNATNEKAKRILGWTPRSNEDSILATAESLIRLGLLKGSQPHSQ